MKKIYQILACVIIGGFSVQVIAQEPKIIKDEEFIIEGWDFSSEIEEDQGLNEDGNLLEMEDLASFLSANEITSIGASGLINRNASIGIAAGSEVINSEYFLRIKPELNLHLSKISLSLGAPIRFSLYDANNLSGAITSFFDGFMGGSKFFRPREVDWDKPSDFLRLLRYITYGKFGDNIFMDLSRINPITIDHGQLVRRFAPNISVDQDNLFSTLKLNFEFFGLQAFMGPFLMPNQFGISVFARPFSHNAVFKFLKSMQFTMNYAGDIKAPVFLKRDGDLLALNSSRRFSFNDGYVHGLGVSLSIELFQSEICRMDFYNDYSHLMFSAINDKALNINSDSFSGGGCSLGLLGR